MQNFFIDHNGSARTTSSENIGSSLLLSNANYCLFENIVFSDCGLNNNVVALPTGPVVNMIAKDFDGDLLDGVVGNCSHNTFRNCRFEYQKQQNVRLLYE